MSVIDVCMAVPRTRNLVYFFDIMLHIKMMWLFIGYVYKDEEYG